MLESSIDLQLLHRAATAYYTDGLRQAQVAERLGISRPTVSKLLAEARRIGMVRIEVLDPPSVDLAELASQVRALLGIDKVLIAPGDQRARDYRGLADLLGEELHDLNLRRGDVLLISSGTTTHAVSRIPSLPELPGVVVAPTIGGQQEPDPTFQTNEIVRTFADRTGAQPQFIFAPALPSPSLWASLQADPSFQEITELWARARVLVTGIGAPYDDRAAMTSVVPREDPGLQGSAGDVCLYFYDETGRTLDFPGSDRLLRPTLAQLRAIPSTIALAADVDKAVSIRAGARANLFTTLIADVPTAEAILVTA